MWRKTLRKREILSVKVDLDRILLHWQWLVVTAASIKSGGREEQNGKKMISNMPLHIQSREKSARKIE